MKPNFCVITTTYKRPESILKNLESVKTQTYTNWRLIIVVDDNLSDYTLAKASMANDPRITCLQNETNLGKNASVNRALNKLNQDEFSGYIVFLDDDDWLAPDCLYDFATAIENNLEKNWLVSQRVDISNHTPFTKNNTCRNRLNYLADALFYRRFTGDSTHCLNFVTTKQILFPTKIKNAEEWLYFAAVAKIHPEFTYLPLAGTYSEGYTVAGLTDNYRQQQENRRNNLAVLKEIWQRKLFSPYVLLYTLGRLVRSLY